MVGYVELGNTANQIEQWDRILSGNEKEQLATQLLVLMVRGATLIGNGPKTLTKIDMVGDNLGYGQGMCGSSSGTIPANVGQPAIRVQDVTVGGRK